MNIVVPASRIPVAFTLVLSICLFVWPVVTGLASLPLRLAWIVVALLLLLLSAHVAAHALRDRPPLTFDVRGTPWWLLGLVSIGLAFPLFGIPFHAFSDEANAALPAFTLLSKTASVVTWPGLLLVGIGVISLFLAAARTLTLRQACAIAIGLAMLAGITAWMFPHQSPLANRYPPLVHVLTVFGYIVGEGNLTAARGANLILTALLFLAVFLLGHAWNMRARIAAFLALMLGPMGWIYHISLYQACGEITFGMTALLLLHAMLREEDRRDLAAYAGILFALWILYRPTSVALLAVFLGLLLISKRLRSVRTVGGIAVPVAILWLALYPSYGYSFLFQEGVAFPALSDSLVAPAVGFFLALPQNFHPMVLGMLVLGSLLVLWKSPRDWKMLLICAWIFGLATALAQQMIIPREFYGYPRYNILLLLPLAIIAAALFQGALFKQQTGTILGAAMILVLVVLTPFDAVLYAQEQRMLDPGRIYRSATGGDSPLPINLVTESALREHQDTVLLAPDFAFLDFYIAKGLLTPMERTRMVQESLRWTPDNPKRPVIVQAPIVTTYQPNISALREEQLRDARTWALQQPHRIVRLGIEEVVIVD